MPRSRPLRVSNEGIIVYTPTPAHFIVDDFLLEMYTSVYVTLLKLVSSVREMFI